MDETLVAPREASRYLEVPHYEALQNQHPSIRRFPFNFFK